MRFDIFTLFPGLVEDVLDYSILGRARERGLVRVEVHDLRRWTNDRHRTADDEPYGGGAGMVMKIEPVCRGLESLGMEPGGRGPGERVVLLSPKGRPFGQETAEEYAGLERVALICGRYEGVDERVGRHLADEELSIGDYVLSGGEIASLVVVEAVSRLVPGVLGDPESYRADSLYAGGILDHPHYTRPKEYHGWSVPEVLLSGDHEKVRLWRRREALRLTLEKRPDLLEQRDLSQEDLILLDEVAQALKSDKKHELERILERKKRGERSPSRVRS